MRLLLLIAFVGASGLAPIPAYAASPVRGTAVTAPGADTEQGDSDEIPYIAEKRLTAVDAGTGTDPHFSTPEAGVRAAQISALTSDDFNRVNLDTARWDFFNPLDDGWLRMTGTGTADAYLELGVPAGTSHDPWGTNRAVRAMQIASDGDVDVSVKFASVPSQRYQMQGLIVEQDADNWLRLEIQHDGANLRLLAIATLNGSSSVKASATISGGASAYLNLTRSGDDWTLRYSTDGNTWVQALNFTQVLTLTAMGPYVANHASAGQTPPAYVARVDYFSATSTAPASEDASSPGDQWSPLPHSLTVETQDDGATISWYTDEPSTGTVEYGTDSGYGQTVTGSAAQFHHIIQLTGLTQGQTYHFRTVSEDAGARDTITTDMTFVAEAQASGIDIWYGGEQTTSALGSTQTWFNLLGNTTSSTLSYRLNGGTPKNVSIGSDTRRLENQGDFNIDLPLNALAVGENTIAIQGDDFTETVTLDYAPNGSPPTSLTIDWSQLNGTDDLQSVAEVIDGKWGLVDGQLRILEPGYDRIVGIGDISWQDFEVQVPVTWYSFKSGQRGLGIIMRWQGHTDVPRVCAQPKCGWLPLGALVWVQGNTKQIYSYDADNPEGDFIKILDETNGGLAQGVTYIFKAQVTTDGNASTYRFKVWPQGQSEPAGWDVEGTAEPEALQTGSVALLAHRYEASFGEVTVTALGGDENAAPIAVNDQFSVVRGGNTTQNLIQNDSDSDGSLDPTSISIVSQPAHGSVVANNNGTVTYTHDGSTAANDEFSYIVHDDQGAASNIATVGVSVVDTDTTPPVIVLNGNAMVTVEAATSYTDAGATATDNVDGDLSAEIVQGGDSVDLTVPGTYRITYDVTDSSGNAAQRVTRTVEVVDTTAPAITLLGDNPMQLEAGTAFVEPGATATDAVDGDLSSEIVITGAVDGTVLGSYTRSYAVTDSRGNRAEPVTRVVTVADTTAPVIVLADPARRTVEAGSEYQLSRYTATDSFVGDLSSAVVVGGDTVDSNRLGTYFVTYNVADPSGNQALQVVQTVVVADTRPPTIALLGNALMVLEYGEPFVEPGVTVTDSFDTALSAQNVVIGGDRIDPETPGIYSITYDITDSSGNAATQAVRQVRVLAPGEVIQHQLYLPYVVGSR